MRDLGVATTRREHPIAIASAVVVVTLIVEYVARHIVARAVPQIASSQATDMLSSAVAYIGLSLAVAVACPPFGEPRGLKGFGRAAARWQAWAGCGAFMVVLPLGLLDHALWGSIALPSFSLPTSNAVVAREAQWLGVLILLACNGIVVPIAEEWLWRGVVQPRFVSRLRPIGGIALTAVLFSLKHAIVDASLGRLVFVVAGGAVLGAVAYTTDWRTSAVTHVFMNTIATAAVILHQSQYTCPKQPPALPPDLEAALPRVMEVMSNPQQDAVDDLFSQKFLGHFPDTVAFLKRVRAQTGPCTVSCIESVDDERHATVLLQCEHEREVMKLGVEQQPPHKVSLFSLRPLPLENDAGNSR